MSKKPNTLTTSEIEIFLSHVLDLTAPQEEFNKRLRNYTMIVLMLDAGLRSGEVVQLKINDLIMHGETVKSLTVRKEIAKRKHERFLPLSIRIQDAIKEMQRSAWQSTRKDNEFAFCSNRYCLEHISNRQLQRIVKTAGLEILGREIHPHIFRHTFASRLMRHVSSRIVQELLGHKNLSSTQIYLHPNNEDLTNAIEKLQS